MLSQLLGHSANDLFWFILPLVLPALLVRYDLSYSQAGAVLTTYLTVTALGSFAAGRLADRFSRRGILAAGLILAAGGLSAAGFAPTLTLFLVIISLTALAMSSFHPVMYAVIDEAYPRRKTLAMSRYETAGTVAILGMFLINGFLLEKIGVRGVLMLTSLPALLMGLCYLKPGSLPPERPRAAAGDRESSPAPSRRELFRFVLFLGAAMLRTLTVAAILNFLPTLLTGFWGFAENTASYATACYFIGGIAGSLLAGKVPERFDPFRVLLWGSLLIAPPILCLTLPLPAAGYLGAILVMGFFASGCLINQNLLMTSLGRHLGTGEVFGVLMGALTLTSAFSPGLLGLALDRWGAAKALSLFALPLPAGALILFFLSQGTRKVRPGAEQSA